MQEKMATDYPSRSAAHSPLAVWMLIVCCVLSAIPANAAFHPADLSAACAAARSNAPAPKSWAQLPRGSNSFGGIPFRVDGRLEVTGLAAASNGEFHPPRLERLPIQGRASRIHLLHGADSEEKDGVPLATVILRYGNGDRRSLRLSYGVHARSWGQSRTEHKSELFHAGSKQAWTGPGAERSATAAYRLFQSAFDNPLPEQEIVGLDFVSLFSRATPFLAGVTLESGAPASADAATATTQTIRRVVKKSLELDDSAYHDEFVIKVTGAESSQPMTNARAALSISDDETSFYFGEAPADATGTIRLSYPPQQAVAFSAVVRAPGRVPLVVGGTKTNGDAFPREIAAGLVRGTRIGGVIREKSGTPVSNAEIVIYHVEQNGPRDYTRIDHETVRTDHEGRWQSESVSPDFTNLTIQVSHPDHRSTAYLAATGSNPGTRRTDVVSRADLANGTAVMELPPALRVEGIVSDQSGRPVTHAELALVETSRGESLRPLRCDQGRFSFVAPGPGEFSIMAQAKGYRPKILTVVAEPEMEPLTLLMARTNPFRGRVMDQNGQPVPGARIKVDSWNGTRLLDWQAIADDQGRFEWDSPAEGNVMFFLTATNYSTMRTSFGSPSGDHVFNLRKMSRIVGRVIDAVTRKPIEEFTVIKGRAYNDDEPIRWDRYDSTRGRRGEYSVRLDDFSSGYSGPRSQILVEAPGYQPVASPPLTNAGIYTNDFELRKGRGLHGTVAGPDGQPLPNVTLALIERSDTAYMERAGELRRSGSGGDYQRSNTKGEFEFPPKLEPHTILASHETGFAEVRVTQFVAGGRIVLQPWGRIKGTLKVGRKVEPGQMVVLQGASWRYGMEGRSGAPLSLSIKVEPEPDGRFVIEKVPPGERRVAMQFRLNDRDTSRSTTTTHARPVVVLPDQTAEVTIGGEGRSVAGRVKVIGAEIEDVDWRRDIHSLQTRIILPSNIQPPVYTPNMSEEDRRKAQAEYTARQNAFWATEAGQVMERARRHYVLMFETNGTFRVDNVEPGSYWIYISPTNPDRGDNYYENLGSVNREVTVPPASGSSDKPHDLGEFELQIRGMMRLGRRAPRFEVKTFEGKTVKLEDFKGRYVLLDFWATWAGTRSLDVQMLKGLHEAYARDDRLVMIGLNFDHEPKAAETAITQTGLKWMQCYAGSWNDTRLPATYGVQGLPEAILIDPDGKIVGKGMRGSTIRNTVRNQLSAPRAGPPKP